MFHRRRTGKSVINFVCDNFFFSERLYFECQRDSLKLILIKKIPIDYPERSVENAGSDYGKKSGTSAKEIGAHQRERKTELHAVQDTNDKPDI
ncbi:MAG: hypothetical protein HYZ14_06890 [Bacteroidetes bacterium]|nr:hypothetical protein [Bacteroidota bacterium]